MWSKNIRLLIVASVFGGLVSGCGSLPNKSTQIYQPAQKTKTEFEKTLERAQQGNAEAQHELGIMYDYGQGVTKNEAEAMKWYRKAADQGLAVAQFYLGWMYEDGRGVQKDIDQAHKWYKKAAEQGHNSARAHLPKTVQERQKTEFEQLLENAEQGDVNAQFDLALRYNQGSNGVKKDYKKAEKWYRKAAEQGDADAQNNLGVMYANGQGTPKDEAEAVKWYRKAAEQGEAYAQNNLGVMYANGLGVVRDEKEAVKWYEKSAKQGHKIAKKNLEGMQVKPTTPVNTNVADKLTLPTRKLNTKMNTAVMVE